MNFTANQVAAASDVPLEVIEKSLPILIQSLESHHFNDVMTEIAAISTLTAHYRWADVSLSQLDDLFVFFKEHRIDKKAKKKNWCGIQLEIKQGWDGWLPFIHTSLNLLRQA